MTNIDRDAHAEEWTLGLAGLTGEEIGEGIAKARMECTWPPSIAEFRKLAIGNANAEQRAFRSRARSEDLAALPTGTWEERKQKAAQELQAIMAALTAHNDEEAKK